MCGYRSVPTDVLVIIIIIIIIAIMCPCVLVNGCYRSFFVCSNMATEVTDIICRIRLY